jgi:glycosyltransferase involved in cell wall biosynthesis
VTEPTGGRKQDTAQPGGKDRVSIAVLVPALNEEKNIGKLLDDIFSQELGEDLVLDEVIVISDGSTDSTEAEVLERCPGHSELRLMVNEKRLGKAVCINVGKRGVTADYLVLVDGDTRLGGPQTLAELVSGLDEGTGMVGGVPVPVKDVGGLAPMIFVCGDILRDYIRKNLKGGSNIYSAHGRILALSRDLYEKVEVPSLERGSRVLSTDQSLYYSCLKEGKRFVLRPDARVIFKLPRSFKDYLLVSVRFMYSATNTTEFFDDRHFNSEFHVPLGIKVRAMLHLFRQKPLGAVAWIGYRLAARTIYLFKRYVKKEEVGAAWEISESTKDSITKT